MSFDTDTLNDLPLLGAISSHTVDSSIAVFYAVRIPYSVDNINESHIIDSTWKFVSEDGFADFCAKSDFIIDPSTDTMEIRVVKNDPKNEWSGHKGEESDFKTPLTNAFGTNKWGQSRVVRTKDYCSSRYEENKYHIVSEEAYILETIGGSKCPVDISDLVKYCKKDKNKRVPVWFVKECWGPPSVTPTLNTFNKYGLVRPTRSNSYTTRYLPRVIRTYERSKKKQEEIEGARLQDFNASFVSPIISTFRTDIRRVCPGTVYEWNCGADTWPRLLYFLTVHLRALANLHGYNEIHQVPIFRDLVIKRQNIQTMLDEIGHRLQKCKGFDSRDINSAARVVKLLKREARMVHKTRPCKARRLWPGKPRQFVKFN